MNQNTSRTESHIIHGQRCLRVYVGRAYCEQPIPKCERWLQEPKNLRERVTGSLRSCKDAPEEHQMTRGRARVIQKGPVCFGKVPGPQRNRIMLVGIVDLSIPTSLRRPCGRSQRLWYAERQYSEAEIC